MEEFKPRHIEFLKYWLDPKSETFDNVKQSAIKAGYSESYADSLTAFGLKWLEEAKKRQKKMLEKAERNLDKALDFSDDDEKKLGIKYDVSKFVAKTLGKKDYSERTEHTGKDGTELSIKVINYGDNPTLPVPSKDLPTTDISGD